MATADEPLNCPDCYGRLEINTVSMHTPAWCVTDLSPLWSTPDVRGGDRLLPGADGVIAYPRRITVTRFSLPMLLTGYCDENGVTYDDPYEGLVTNWRYLWDTVAEPIQSNRGLRSAELTTPGGTVITADVHVLGIRGQLIPGAVARLTLELSVPGGDLHVGA